METATLNIQKLMIDTVAYTLLDNCRAEEKDGRESLTYINVRESGVIETTDGRILVRIENTIANETKITKGVYKILSANKWSKIHTELTLEAVDIHYPETDPVIPKETAENITVLIQKKEIHALTIVKIFQYTGSVVSEKYLELLGFAGLKWKVSKTEKNRAVLLKSIDGKYTVTLMPLQFNAYDCENCKVLALAAKDACLFMAEMAKATNQSLETLKESPTFKRLLSALAKVETKVKIEPKKMPQL